MPLRFVHCPYLAFMFGPLSISTRDARNSSPVRSGDPVCLQEFRIRWFSAGILDRNWLYYLKVLMCSIYEHARAMFLAQTTWRSAGHWYMYVQPQLFPSSRGSSLLIKSFGIHFTSWNQLKLGGWSEACKLDAYGEWSLQSAMRECWNTESVKQLRPINIFYHHMDQMHGC